MLLWRHFAIGHLHLPLLLADICTVTDGNDGLLVERCNWCDDFHGSIAWLEDAEKVQCALTPGRLKSSPRNISVPGSNIMRLKTDLSSRILTLYTVTDFEGLYRSPMNRAGKYGFKKMNKSLYLLDSRIYLSSLRFETIPRISTICSFFSCWIPMLVAMKQPVLPMPAL